ncbi:thioredoxin family protein [Paenibacillus sp. GCM10027628]
MQQYRDDLRCLILCTDWCPDVIWNIPVQAVMNEFRSV